MREELSRLAEACFVLVLLVVLVVVLLAFPIARTWGDEPAKFEPSERQLLLHEEAQRHRIANGRSRQEIDESLCELSQRWAEHMARSGSRNHGGGEQIIAWGQPSAAGAMRTWISSSGHNYWLLSSTSRAGWGAARSPGGQWCWVGAFRNAPAVPPAQPPIAGPIVSGETRPLKPLRFLGKLFGGWR